VSFTIADSWLPTATAMIRNGRSSLTCSETTKMPAVSRPSNTVPVWRDLLAVGGMVRGTRDNVRALMRARETIPVFPGGSREVNKVRGEQVPAPVRERIGFARWPSSRTTRSSRSRRSERTTCSTW
jgi:hypothetical protein